MILGVRDIFYNVSDMKRAIEFYTKALQMKLMFAEDGWTGLDCHGVHIGLHPQDEGEELFIVPRDSQGAHGQATLTLHSNNIAEDKKRIVEHGGVIIGEDDAPWGHMLVFEDPDKNVLKLMNPKY